MSEAKAVRDHSGTGIWRRSMAAASARRGEVGLERVADALGPELEAGAAAELVGDRLLDQDAAEAAPGRQGDGRPARLAPGAGGARGAPRVSRQERLSEVAPGGPATSQPTATRLSGAESAPCLAALVASSCSTMLSVSAALGVSVTSLPLTATCWP